MSYFLDDEIQEVDEDEEIEQQAVDSQITNKDINDIAYAKKCGFDCITISNVSKPEHIKEVPLSFPQS